MNFWMWPLSGSPIQDEVCGGVTRTVSKKERSGRGLRYVAEQVSEKGDNSRPGSTGTSAVATAPPAKKKKKLYAPF